MLSTKPLLSEQIDSELAAMPRDRVFSCSSRGSTHVGRVRSINEDAFAEYPDEGFWVVADGMGGLSRGDYASKATMRALSDYQTGETLSDCLEDLQQKLNEANETCLNAFRGKRIGATVAALHIFGDLALIIWAGDSRIYRLRDGELEQMTRDHSVAEEKRERGELSREEADSHQTAHVLTRAVGVHKRLYPELRYEKVQDGDRFLLCTDGALIGQEDSDIRSALKHSNKDGALGAIIDKALDSGGRDNITAVVVHVDSN